MAETLYATSHITGSCSTPGNAVGASDGSWTDNGTNDDWTSRWAMGNPSAALASTTQTIEVLARIASAGGSQPTLTINLYENGSLVSSSIGSATVTSTTGQTVTGTFNGSVISNEANVEIELVSSHGGGSPSGRYEAQIDEIKWTADVASTDRTGSGSPTLADSTSTASGTYTSPPASQWTHIQTQDSYTAGTGTTTTVNISATSGNLLVAAINIDKTASGFTTPTGYTLIGTAENVGNAQALYYRVATGDSNDNCIFAWTDTTQWDAYVYEFASPDGTPEVSASDVIASASTSSGETISSMGTASAAGLLVAFAGADTSTVSDSVTFSGGTGSFTNLASNIGTASDSFGQGAYKTVASSGSLTVTSSWTQTDENTLGAAFFTVVSNDKTGSASVTLEDATSNTSASFDAKDLGAIDDLAGTPGDGQVTLTWTAPAVISSNGIFISDSEIDALTQSGTAWTNMKAAADAFDGSTQTVYDVQDDEDCAAAYAAALAFAATGTEAYRTEVETAIDTIANAAYVKATSPLAWARTMTQWILASELIDLASHNPTLDSTWKSFLAGMPDEPYSGEGGTSLGNLARTRANNIGLDCRITCTVIGLYTNDWDLVGEMADLHKEWCEGQTVYGFDYNIPDGTWQEDPSTLSTYIGVNRLNATKDGNNIDGILPDDYRRNGAYDSVNFPDVSGGTPTTYPSQAVGQLITFNWILYRAGYRDVWSWGDSAAERAYVRFRWCTQNGTDFTWGEASGGLDDQRWYIFLAEQQFGLGYPKPSATAESRPVSWTDWTHP